MKTINSRIASLFDEAGYDKNEVASHLGLTKKKLSKKLDGLDEWGAHELNKLKEFDPEIRINWILTGRGKKWENASNQHRGIDDWRIVNDRVKEIRMLNNLTQQDFSDRMNISRTTQSGIENHISTINVGYMRRLNRFFGVSYDWLIDGKVKQNEVGKLFDRIRQLEEENEELKAENNELQATKIKLKKLMDTLS